MEKKVTHRTEYRIEQEHNGAWWGVDFPPTEPEAIIEIEQRRKENPGVQYRLKKITPHEEIIG